MKKQEFNWIKRKNIYNEDAEEEELKVPAEENLIVATWINDMEGEHKEFDVRITQIFLIERI
jgi:hypothetical protein